MSGLDKEFREIYSLIASKKNILLTTHERPDADGVGCELALKRMLDAAGLTSTIINESAFPDLYDFLPGADQVRIYPDGYSNDYDLVICIDAGSLDRLGPMAKAFAADLPVINIDHHISNEQFGTYNLVDADMSSSGEMVYHLMKANGIAIDAEIATCLYTSIVTDTGRFAHGNTSPRVLRAAAELVEVGVDPEDVSRRIYGSKTMEVMKLQSLALATLSFSDDGSIAWLEVTNAMHDETSTLPMDTQDFVDIPRGIRGVKIAFLIREGEDPAFTRVSMRSNNAVDVNQVAQVFGGGGHRKASGCTIDKPMAQARELLLSAVRDALKAE